MADNASQQKAPGMSKPIVMIGLMGAGKSRIGRDLATKVGLPFVDADDEIVKAERKAKQEPRKNCRCDKRQRDLAKCPKWRCI